MTGRRPDDLPPELLAAYADGELGPRDRARVERWLADHPEARDLLEDQEALAPANAEFWAAVRPPEPTTGQWDRVRDEIRSSQPAPVRRVWPLLFGSLALMATAAALLLAVPALDRLGRPAPPALPPARPAVEEPFAMAGDEDVRIISLPEDAAGLLVVGEHPVPDPLLLLARADEIEFHGVGSDEAGRFPAVPADPAADEAPMIWAPRAP